MTDRPIDLDGRRTSDGRLKSELRRRAANTGSSPEALLNMADAEIDAAMLAGPARTWIEVTEKTSFLLERYAATREAGDARIQKLIKRAQSDLARLRKREERSG